MLEAAQPLGAIDALDAELAEQLLRALLAVPADWTTRSHCRRTVRSGWIAEKTRRPAFRK